MVMMAGIDIPVKAVRDYISSALSLMVHLSRLRDGSRRVTQISEIVGMEGDVVTMQDIFTFQQAGVDDAGRVIGVVQPTGIRPSFADHLASVGSPLPPEVFSAVATESERAA